MLMKPSSHNNIRLLNSNARNANVLHVTPQLPSRAHISRYQGAGVCGGVIRLIGARCAPLEANTEQP